MIILLSDKRISSVICNDNGEEMVSLRNLHHNILIDESRSQISSRSDYFCYARQEVANKLKKAVELLPEGYQFLVKEAYRPLERQQKCFEESFLYYKNLYPNETEDYIYDLTSQYVAPIEVAGHPTGGAVDVTLLKDGIEIDMGTAFNDEPIAPENLTYLYSDYITTTAKQNRKILIDVMEAVGFMNYPTEWWHWSYGDCYWAYFNHTDALYAGVKEEDIELSGINNE